MENEKWVKFQCKADVVKLEDWEKSDGLFL